MFFLKSNFKEPLSGGSARRLWAYQRAPVILLCLVTALLFVSCNTDLGGGVNNNFIPVGEWTDGYGSGYNITNSSIEYYAAAWGKPGDIDYWPSTKTEGVIEEANDFSSNAGVLLVRITFSDGGFTQGKFIGVYYKNYTLSHVLFANAINASYAYIEKDTLAEARRMFNAGNVGTHVTFWGSGYTK